MLPWPEPMFQEEQQKNFKNNISAHSQSRGFPFPTQHSTSASKAFIQAILLTVWCSKYHCRQAHNTRASTECAPLLTKPFCKQGKKRKAFCYPGRQAIAINGLFTCWSNCSPNIITGVRCQSPDTVLSAPPNTSSQEWQSPGKMQTRPQSHYLTHHRIPWVTLGGKQRYKILKSRYPSSWNFPSPSMSSSVSGVLTDSMNILTAASQEK